MFMRGSARCAHQVRPPPTANGNFGAEGTLSATGLDAGDGLGPAARLVRALSVRLHRDPFDFSHMRMPRRICSLSGMPSHSFDT
jgi:hypothetical protein